MEADWLQEVSDVVLASELVLLLTLVVLVGVGDSEFDSEVDSDAEGVAPHVTLPGAEY